MSSPIHPTSHSFDSFRIPATSKNQAIIDAAKLSENAPSCNGCDEYEKMISGMYFTISKCRKLQEHRLKTRKQLQDFNDESITDNCTLDSMKSRRMNIARQMLGKLGERVEIEAPFFCGWGSNIFIGDSVYMNRNVSIFDNSLVHIGNYVRIEPDVTICTDTHEVDPIIRIERGTSFACPIVIEDHCWIGARATILPGVRVGRGSTVAAGAVVSKDVEAGTVVGGVPAKVIKKLSNEAPTSSKGFS